MSSRKKIWSVPIAVLALALMLAGALLVTGIVQANTVYHVTITGPDGNAVPLTVMDSDIDGSDTTTQHAVYEFSINAATTAYTGNFTITGPADRTLTVSGDSDEEANVDGFQIPSELSLTAKTQNITVEHQLTADPGTGLDQQTVYIRLTIESAAPTVDAGIDDDEFGTDAAITVTGLLTSAVDGGEAFNDADADDSLIYVAMVKNPKVATIAFGDTNSHINDTGEVIEDWWNSLSCRERNNALGKRGGAEAQPGAGTCQNFDDLGTNDQDDNDESTDEATVVQAFLWDMLTGPEMVYAAKAGALSNPAGYNKPFANLTPEQRVNVATLYADGDADDDNLNILAAGAGTLTVTQVNLGTTDIVVKASDSAGRFLADSVGTSFAVSEGIQILNSDDDDGDGGADGIQIESRLSGSSASQGGATVVEVLTSATHSDADTPLAAEARLGDGLVFLLTGTDAGDFYVDSSGVVTTASALSAGSYEFMVTAAIHGVDDSADVSVAVGHSNRAPEVISGSTTEFDVVEQGQNGQIARSVDVHNFMLNFTDPDRERNLAFAIKPAVECETDADKLEDNDPACAFVGNLAFAAGGSVLKTNPRSFEWTDPDDDDEADNSHSFVVTATDGSGAKAEQTITVNVTDYEAPPEREAPENVILVDENLTVDTDDDDLVEVPINDATGTRVTTGYEIVAQSPFGLLEDDEDEDEDPEDGPVWDVTGEGKLKLKAGALPPNFEDDEYPNQFIIAVSAGPAQQADGTFDEIVRAFTIQIQDVEEAPKFDEDSVPEVKTAVTGLEEGQRALFVLETTVLGDPIGQVNADGSIREIADDEQTGQIVAVDEDAGDVITFSLMQWTDDDEDEKRDDDEWADHTGPFSIDSNGVVAVSGMLDTDDPESTSVYSMRAVATDTTDLESMFDFEIKVVDANEAPMFDSPSLTDGIEVTLDENSSGAEDCQVVDPNDSSNMIAVKCIFDYHATDADDDHLVYKITDSLDAEFFNIDSVTGAVSVAAGKALDYETHPNGFTIEIVVEDSDRDTGATDELDLKVKLVNLNDNDPTIAGASRTMIAENTRRDTVLEIYKGTDADGDIDGDGTVVSYSLRGTHSKSFDIVETGQDTNDNLWQGELRTVESLDYDSGTPCPVAGCEVMVVASDGEREAIIAVTIVVTNAEDSVSTLNVTKANPVPGTTMGDSDTALGNTKMSVSSDVPERPGDLPNTAGAPLNFVETDWANWGTVLRIEVTSQSPGATCDDGNECVVISLNSDSADDTLKVKAYRMDTSAGAAASNENKFVAAVMLVELDGDATDIKDSGKNDIPVYMHGDGSAPRLQVDEEDEIEIEFGNLRGDIEVENEAPEISNFAPEHESAFDDPDVEYTFTVVDSHSGLPEPEDLPDADGDDAYMPAVALISKGQCETADSDASTASKARRAKLISDGFSIVEDMENISDDGMLYCPGVEQDGEYDASGAGYGFAPIRDDKDFDDIDDGFDVETTIVLRENRIFYVTFVACDNAGNCSFFDPDGNDDGEELAEITVDTEDPVFVEARTGLTWDSTDNEYDDNRSFIQVIFNDLTKLNTETVEIDDFVVEGHTIKDVQVYENPDSDDVDWGDSGRYGAAGHPNKRGIARYRDIENVVFIELEDELLADETPDVTIVPNGVEDKAGNEQDDGDHEADDWISPAFTIVSIVSTRETSQDQVLAGDDDEVTVVVTSDERLDSTRPTVMVTYVIAPAGSIDTKGTATCDTDDGDDKGTRERGEIVNSDECADSGAATGGNLNNSVEKVSNTEWIVTITEPKDTGYYNFRISGNDRSPQENPGSEGVSPGSIVTDFFDADGDVNVDDAIFFEGDINLPKPQVRVSGVSVEDNEADVEFRSPLFVELDFAANHSDNCRNVDNDERMANCMNENSEYAEDNFDDIVVTSFMLDGVDLTDSVKTTDNQSFLVSLESISIGDHTAEVQAVDQAGNVFEDTLEIDFEVNDRDPFEKRLSPGWNLVSLPGEPADSSIAAVFGPGVEVRTVYSYDPVIPGGWMVAVRETLDSDWQGDLTEITGQHGYWVLSDAIQDWEVSIPRLAGGAAGTGTPIQPPVIPLYAGWNLIPVTDVKGNALDAGVPVSAATYLQSLDDGVVPARVLGFDTIRNEWYTVLDGDMTGPGMGVNLEIGSGYWVFVREAISLVPGGAAGGGSGD